jgi:hypothetical protein
MITAAGVYFIQRVAEQSCHHDAGLGRLAAAWQRLSSPCVLVPAEYIINDSVNSVMKQKYGKE